MLCVMLALACAAPASAFSILSCSAGCTLSPDSQPYWVDYGFSSQGQRWTFNIVSADPNATFSFGSPNQFQTGITYFDGTVDVSLAPFPFQFERYEMPGTVTYIVRAASSFDVCSRGGPPREICAISHFAIGNSVGMTITSSAPITIFSSFQAVPEPATWAMLIAGFGLSGATLRRRRYAGSTVRLICTASC